MGAVTRVCGGGGDKPLAEPGSLPGIGGGGGDLVGSGLACAHALPCVPFF